MRYYADRPPDVELCFDIVQNVFDGLLSLSSWNSSKSGPSLKSRQLESVFLIPSVSHNPFWRMERQRKLEVVNFHGVGAGLTGPPSSAMIRYAFLRLAPQALPAHKMNRLPFTSPLLSAIPQTSCLTDIFAEAQKKKKKKG